MPYSLQGVLNSSFFTISSELKMGLGFHGPPNRWQLWGLSVQPSVLDQEAAVEGVSGSTARTLAFAPGPLPDRTSAALWPQQNVPSRKPESMVPATNLTPFPK